MFSFKNTLRKSGKYLMYAILYFLSLSVIGMAAGISFFLAAEHSYKIETTDIIKDCIAQGASEQICKDRVY